MRLPVDITQLDFRTANDPRPVLDYETKQQRTDREGNPLFSVRVFASGEDIGQVIEIKTAGEPGRCGPQHAGQGHRADHPALGAEDRQERGGLPRPAHRAGQVTAGPTTRNGRVGAATPARPSHANGGPHAPPSLHACLLPARGLELMAATLSGHDARQLLPALHALRRAGLDPTVLTVTPNEPTEQECREDSDDRGAA